jgi:hypothetical protein
VGLQQRAPWVNNNECRPDSVYGHLFPHDTILRFKELRQYYGDTTAAFRIYKPLELAHPRRDSFRYDAQGRTIFHRKVEYSHSSGAINSSKLDLYYYQQGSELLDSVLYLDFANDFSTITKYSKKYHYQYRPDGQRHRTEQWNFFEDSQEWLYVMRAEYHYNSEGQLLAVERYSWEDDVFVLWHIETNTYDEQGRLIEIYAEQADGTPIAKAEYEYFPAQRLTRTRYFIWWYQDWGWDWEEGPVEEIGYDELGRLEFESFRSGYYSNRKEFDYLGISACPWKHDEYRYLMDHNDWSYEGSVFYSPLENPDNDVVRLPDNDWQFFPNPATDQVSVLAPVGAEIRLYNALGQLLYQQQSNGLNRIDVRHLPTQYLFLQVELEGQLSTEKLLIQRR